MYSMRSRGPASSFEGVIVGYEESVSNMSTFVRDAPGFKDDRYDTRTIAGAGALGAWACR